MRVHFSVAFLALLAAAALHAQNVRTDSSAPPSQPLPLALVQQGLRERVTQRIGSDSITIAPVDTPSAGEVFARVGLGAAGAGLGALGLIPRGNAKAITSPLGAAIGAGVSSAFC